MTVAGEGERRATELLPEHSGATRLVAYMAAAWAFVFAAMSFYWAAGGTAGASTLGETITRAGREREPLFVAILWGTGALKAIAGVGPLALARPWGGRIPRWISLVATWSAGVLFALYGGANLAVRGLMAAGAIETPASMHSTAARWHLLLWDPWWLLGGVLFIVAAWQAGRRS
jgi:hypothetical protein